MVHLFIYKIGLYDFKICTVLVKEKNTFHALILTSTHFLRQQVGIQNWELILFYFFYFIDKASVTL